MHTQKSQTKRQKKINSQRGKKRKHTHTPQPHKIRYTGTHTIKLICTEKKTKHPDKKHTNTKASTHTHKQTHSQKSQTLMQARTRDTEIEIKTETKHTEGKTHTRKHKQYHKE